MAGLQTLMQRGQMPGQAGSFSALPGQQGRNPVAFTASLKQLPPEELISLYNDPNDLRPKWAVASAYADAMKAKALQQGVEGQQAMAQNAAAQQQPPVADEVMTRMAASGGEMRAYADGGAINFENGGDIPANLIRNPDYDENGAPRSPTERDSIIRQNAERIRAYKQEQENKGKSFFQRLNPDEPLRQVYDYFQKPQTERKPILDAVGEFLIDKLSPAAKPSNASQLTPPTAATPSTSPTAEKYQVRQVSGDQETPQPAKQGIAALSDPGLTQYARRLEEDYRKLMDIRGKQGEVSPEIKAARGRLEEMRAGQLQKIQEDSGKIREEGIRQLQGRLDSARRPLIEDPEALLALAASINTEKGKVLGSLSAGGAKVLGERRSRAEKAEEGISALSDKIRLLNSQYMEAQALEEQRKLATLTNDAEGKRNAEIASAQLAVEMRKTQAEIDYRMRSADAEREKARVAGEGTAATREATNVQKLAIALKDRQEAYQNARKQWLEDMTVRLVAMKASASDAKPEDVNAWKKKQQDFENEFRNSPEIKNRDAAIARLGQLAGVPLSNAWSIKEVPAQTGGK